MGVQLVSTAGITAASTFIADREARFRQERQIVAGFGAVTQVLDAPPSERARLVIQTALELAGFGPVAELIPVIFGVLDIGRKFTAPQNILRDLITFGDLAPEKIRRLEELKPIDQERFVVRIKEWAKEIVAPGTGQPVIATRGFLPRERGILRPVIRFVRRAPGRFGRTITEPIVLADGTPLLEVGGRRKVLRFRAVPTDLNKFRQTAANLRRLAENRGLL